jgi:TM2 domain-containing membrane protein YozV
MFCPKCGSPNDDGAHFCAKCGNTLAPAGEPAAAGASPTGGTMRTASSSGGGGQIVTGKSPAIALVLSVVLGSLGVGQFYNGDWKKGLTMAVASVLLAVPTGGLVPFGVWIWAMVDAFQVASGKWKAW